MSQPTLYVMRGLPGSGKSTEARKIIKEFEARGEMCIRLNKDEIRLMMGYSNWNNNIETVVREAIDKMTLAALREGISVINDNTNLSVRDIADANENAEFYNANLIVDTRCLGVPVDECIARDAQRTGSAKVGSDVIRGFVKKYPNLFKNSSQHENE